MVRNIDRRGVQELVRDRDAQIVEVLSRRQYEWAHLPGAVHRSLAKLDVPEAWGLDRARPVIVYCQDLQCDLSPRAAHRLERLGHPEVYDYAAGKLDWLSADLPYEGHAELVSRVVRRDPVVAAPEDRMGEVADRVLADPAGVALVVDASGVVQGVIGERELAGAPDEAPAERFMNPAVPTVRPSEDAADLMRRADRAGLHEIVVTRPDATPVGIVATAIARSPRSGPR
ncbi:hypothetical protein Acsp03_01700 [Actinomadura sp. NBRC 104412]|uniref:rhodanese-like domain-containing protein n=1 Tax=Actinomadura sp. NBRC 104412 TaxID=3032203 RepID=UPI0024A250E2|nr:rhodanese-like domain-containing protein [Actinomadura sp. NBRC 104412]GLZ02703.1 hypothetical protein Acsp03_01700 [Actinomadura sp. NBRC 104412]